MLDFEIIDEYGYEDYEYLDKVIKTTLKHEKVSEANFSIVFINDETMQKLNFTYRGINHSTDVLSFAFEDNEYLKLPIRQLGDIFISIPKMKQQAKEYGHSEKRELSFLVVHGLLHLLGYDHTRSIEEEKQQFAIQDAILNELNIKI